MMHKIILQIFLNHKSHGLLNAKLMYSTFDFHFYMDYVTVHWLMGCVLGTWNYKDIISNKHTNKLNNELNF